MTGAHEIALALRAIAAAIREHAHQGLCCSEHTIVERRGGRTWWRRHEWNADQWAPLALPGVSIKTGPAKRAHRRRRR